MKIIKVPSPDAIEIEVVDKRVNVTRQERVTFARFLKDAVEGYLPFGKGLRNIRAGAKILDALERLDGQPTLALEDSDYLMLKDAVAETQLNPQAARRLIGFIEAVGEPSDVR